MKQLRYILICISALLSTQLTVAQSSKPNISTSLSADTVMIGDRVTLTVEVEKDVMQYVVFPTFDFTQKTTAEGGEQPESQEPSIEVINDFAPDTISQQGRRVLLRKRYEMAVYDEGIYHLGRAKVLYADKNLLDTLTAEREESFVVNTFQIDSTMTTVRDLKPQKTLKLRFAEFGGYLGIAFGALLLLALAIYLLVRHLAKHGRSLSDLFKPAPPVPAHILAIEALERLHNEKLWQNDKHKQYYSALSDILRTYLAGRFEVGAMEMTTDEIAEALRTIEVEQKPKMDLLSVLRDADLVKFAKATPEAEENELAYTKAYYFVEETKPVEVVEDDEDAPTKNEKEAMQ